VKTDKPVWLGSSIALWVTAVSCFAVLLKCQAFPFGAAVVLGLLVHSALAVLLDRMYFGGRLTLWQWVGIVFAVVAIILVSHDQPQTAVTPVQEARTDQP
jgi:uncharacterized membrane protein